MLFVSLRDLQWRRWRFLIGVLATGLVFALTVVMSGVSQSFHNEIQRTVGAFDIDTWVVPSDVTGPFTSTRVFPSDEAQKIKALPGVKDAEAVAIFRGTVDAGGVKDIDLIGITPGGMIAPKIADGTTLKNPGDLVVDRSLGLKVGDEATLAGAKYTVVGRTNGLTYFAGTPTAYASISDVQNGGFSGAKLATAIVLRGQAKSLPKGYGASDPGASEE